MTRNERDNPGVIALPPLIALATLAAGLGLDRLVPIGAANAMLTRSWRFTLAAILLLTACWIVFRAVRTFGRVGTPLDVRKASVALAAERLAQGASKLRRDSDWLPYRLIFLAKALWQIRPNPRWPAAVIDVLASADEPIQRQTAAEELYDVRDPATVRALMTALDDPEGLVRHHAARGLLAIHGLPVDSDDAAHMTYRVMSDAAARREGGKRDILAAIAGRPIAAP